MPNWKKLIVSGSDAVLNSATASNGFFGTASWAVNAQTASYAAQASDITLNVINQTGTQINKGAVVRISGSNNSSDTPRIALADWTDDNQSANTLGLAMSNIPNGSTGLVLTEGVFLGYDTSTPGWTNGQVLYLSASGAITGAAPQAPLHGVRLGQVIRVQNPNGSIYVRIDNGYELDELHDIKINSATSGDLLIRSSSLWINSKQLTGSYGLTGSLTATSLTGSLFGTASWARNALTASYLLGGSSGTPGGSNTEIQFNSASAFAGSASFTFNYLLQSLQQGNSTSATGPYSHAEGTFTQAIGEYSHAEGSGTIASGSNSHAEGGSTTATGIASHAEGDNTQAIGDYSHAEGGGTIATGSYSHAEGQGTQAIGEYSHAEGSNAQAIGNYSHAEGNGTIASGSYSHAEGYIAQAIGESSHAEGYDTRAIGEYSHAEGYLTVASGSWSHAEGRETQAIGLASHAEGRETQAIGNYSHAEGQNTQAIGEYSHAEGFNTIASGFYQHVQGQFNITSSAQSTFIIGNGTADNARSNLVFASGSEFQITGSLQVLGSITGSLLGTASFASTASSVSTLNQVVTINGDLIFNAPSSPGFNGEIVRFGAGTLTTGQLYFLSSSGTWSLANANSTGSSVGMLGLAMGSSPTTNGLLIRGFAVSSSYTYGTGSIVYMATSSGAMTATSPSSSNHVVRVMGYQTTLSNTIYFDPDKTWVTLA